MMYCKCDGCGKEAMAESANGKWFKPRSWYERTPLGEPTTTMQACSRECIDKIEAKRKEQGKQSTTVVLPI